MSSTNQKKDSFENTKRAFKAYFGVGDSPSPVQECKNCEDSLFNRDERCSEHREVEPKREGEEKIIQKISDCLIFAFGAPKDEHSATIMDTALDKVHELCRSLLATQREEIAEKVKCMLNTRILLPESSRASKFKTEGYHQAVKAVLKLLKS